MTEKPLVSVITPVFNGEKYIRECLESVLGQHGVSFEHIVVDDGSTDRTPAIVSEYPDVVFLQQERKGAATARNVGLNCASGKFVKFLDADDLLVDGALEKQYEVSLSNGENEITYGYSELFSESGEKIKKYRLDRSDGTHWLADLIIRNIVTSLSLYPLEALKHIGGFDERMHARQEWDLNIRLACAGYVFKYSDVFVYRQRQHEGDLRINNRKFVYEKERNNLDYTFETVSRYKESEVIDAWSYKLWHLGRKFISQGDVNSAKKFFEEARSYSASGYKKYYSKKYRFFSALLGPILADRTFFYLRKFSRKL